MTEAEWDDNESVTITRGELADILAKRLDLESEIIKNHISNPVAAVLLDRIITRVCADIGALVFKDTTLEKLAEELSEKDIDLGGLEIDEGAK